MIVETTLDSRGVVLDVNVSELDLGGSSRSLAKADIHFMSYAHLAYVKNVRDALQMLNPLDTPYRLQCFEFAATT